MSTQGIAEPGFTMSPKYSLLGRHSDYENDVIRLPADIVGKIAQELEVTRDELLGLKREARSTDSVKNRRLSRRLQAIDALPKRDQEALLRTIDAFISKTA
jgi:hypothetical protein